MEKSTFKHPSIDRGWAWVITFAVFGSCILCVGYFRAFGVFFVAIIDTFDTSASVTSLIMGVQNAVFCVSALLVHNVLLELVSVRTSAMLGGLLMASGMMLGMFAYSLPFLILGLSVLVGVGNALTYGPGLVLLGQYFEKRRAMAMSLANAGSSVGSMTLPLLATHLVKHYGLRPALLLYGAVTLHLCVFTSLYRPLSVTGAGHGATGHSSSQEESGADSTAALLAKKRQVEKGDNCHSQESSSPGKHKPEDMKEDSDDEGSAFPEKHKSNGLDEENLRQRAENTKLLQQKDIPGEITKGKDGVTVEMEKFAAKRNHLKLVTDRVKDVRQFSSSDNVFAGKSAKSRLHEKRSLTEADLSTFPGKSHLGGKNSGLASSVGRKLFGSAALHASQPHLMVTAYATISLQSLSDETVTVSEENVTASTGGKLKDFCSLVFDVKLLRNPLFWLVQAYVCVGVMGATGAGSYMPSMCREKGLDKDDTAIVLTTWGACNLVGRLASGVVADRKWLRPSHISALSFVAIAVLFHTLRLLPHNFTAVMAFGVLYGMFEGTYFTMLPLIIIDFVSLDNFSRTFGFAQLSQGAFATVLYPVLGRLRDVTGNYHATFHLLGACSDMATVLLLLEPVIRALKWAKPRDILELSSERR
ncbi:hypothetical protein BaRGS_00003224 [Batillaria attramentaria]|uniref:Monocarboxylate transporter n=1 Tax=Batillaria attramentaria TaxID=370345 RepID=A0ABD0M2D6_9CAEN